MQLTVIFLIGLYLFNGTLGLDFDCTDITDPEKKFAHPTNCASFVNCHEGEPVELNCQPGTIFDPESSDCIEGECEEPTTDEPTNTNDVTTELPGSSNTDDVTTELPGSSELECPKDQQPNEITFIPSPTDCEQYYMCTNNNMYPMACRSGLHFNRETNLCDYPESANCVIDNNGVDQDGIPLCDKDKAMYYMAHPHKCRYFIFCLVGTRYIQACPVYKSWDVNLEQCVDSSVVVCAEGAE